MTEFNTSPLGTVGSVGIRLEMFNTVDSYVCGVCDINHDEVVEISRTLEPTADEIAAL